MGEEERTDGSDVDSNEDSHPGLLTGTQKDIHNIILKEKLITKYMVHFSVQTSQKYKWRTYNTQCLINGDNRGKFGAWLFSRVPLMVSAKQVNFFGYKTLEL